MKKMSTALYLGIGGSVLLLIIIIVAYMMMSGKKDDDTTGSNTTGSTGSNTTGSTGSNTTGSSINNKFTLLPSKLTTKQTDGGGNTVYLDRHNVDCTNNALNKFKLQTIQEPPSGGLGGYVPQNEIQYDYTCSSSPSLKDLRNENTPWNPESDKSWYLNSHNVDCGKNKVINKFQLVRDGNPDTNSKKFRYSYNCSDAGAELTCRDVSTTQNNSGGGNVIYLDRHNVECREDEAISQFQLVALPQTGEIKYKYKCCKY